jgi:organic radical activating enzyme
MDIFATQNIPLETLVLDIQKASQYFHTKTLRIIGGEPLLHPNLSQFIQDFKAIKIADSIELWTNGTLIDFASKSNWELLDGIVISKYPNISNPWDSESLTEISKKYNVWIHIRDCKSFSWSINCERNNINIAKILHNNCREAATCHTIRNGKFYKCVQSAFARDRLALNTVLIEDDGIELHSSNNIFEKIEKHLWSKVPLNACYYCLGEFGARFPHEQNSHKMNYAEEINFDSHFITP